MRLHSLETCHCCCSVETGVVFVGSFVVVVVVVAGSWRCVGGGESWWVF